MSTTEPEHAGPRIVVGYDGSQAARAAVRVACARAGRDGRVVVVLSPDGSAERFVTGATLSLLEDRDAYGQALLDELLMEEAEALTETDFDLALVHGDPADAIVKAAHDNAADEIAIGTRGAGRVGSLLGSVAQDVLHRAECPVLVIPRRAALVAGIGLAAKAVSHG